MEFQRPELNDSVASLVRSASLDYRCLGRNYMIEENVSDRRLAEVEAYEQGEAKGVLEVVGEYFKRSVVGEGSEHRSSTFDEKVNGLALRPDSLEPTQKIIRLEIIDRYVKPRGTLDFNDLVEVIGTADQKKLSLLTDLLCNFRNSRPSFAALKDDVATDLDGRDWLETILDRLGLYHHYPGNQNKPRSFALMEYTASEVIEQAGTRAR